MAIKILYGVVSWFAFVRFFGYAVPHVAFVTVDLEIWPLQSNLSRLEELRFFLAIEILILVHEYTLIYLVSTSVFAHSNWFVHKYGTLHSTRYILQEISYFIYVC